MDVNMSKKKTIEERLLKNSQQKDDCIIWQGAINNAGYGMVRVKNKMVTVHRTSYETYIGQVPTGLNVCHTCDNKLCHNPKHLIALEHKENLHKRRREGRKYCRNEPTSKT